MFRLHVSGASLHHLRRMHTDRQRQLVVAITSKTSSAEQDALAQWATELLALRAGPASTATKVKRAIALTIRSPVLIAAVKLASREIKRHGWEGRSWPARLGLGAAAAGLALFGGQGAGIAALGTAVGVPLWVVLGSGGAFAGVLLDEISRSRRQ